MDTTAFLLLSFSSLFAVIDPLGAIPFFSGLTSHMDPAQKRQTLFKALAVAFGVLLVFILLGHQVLEMFGITLDAFRIAGGIIFFGIGLDMLQSKPRRWQTGIKRAYAADQQESEEEEEIDDPSVTPLGIPLMAGPGSITPVMMLEICSDDFYVTRRPGNPVELIENLEDYLMMPLQTSRGCPHKCEFCSLPVICGN